jgi:xylulose-5-phosphate/fructose-6-phosphate phosphoketolase
METEMPQALMEKEKAAKSLSSKELSQIDAYWRASNYLSVGQIYLYANPLLREPLTEDHVKPRLLGHWGTTPGLNFIYVHLNRLIKAHDLSMLYITGPGHGGPALVANAWLEGTYSEVYPTSRRRSRHGSGCSSNSPSRRNSESRRSETPGSIHEGGELGYALSHAFGAAFDNPDLIVACVVGDGEAETGPLATSWHSNKFLNPATDGAVLPILHLNGYKIANPTVLARISHDELDQLFGAMVTRLISSKATTRRRCTRRWRPRSTRLSPKFSASRRRPAAACANGPRGR